MARLPALEEGLRMSRALAHRLRRLEERWALQMARRLQALPLRLGIAALIDAAPEDLLPDLTEDEILERLIPAWGQVRRGTPQDPVAHMAQTLLAQRDDPAVQRLLAALATYEMTLSGR